ncbi:hypothetical protein [Salinisphaera orenii]|uniref:hypothetical protein n=1 Tax=Salinisphaera orenii TaxID=856731 RepID=UPI0013A68557
MGTKTNNRKEKVEGLFNKHGRHERDNAAGTVHIDNHGGTVITGDNNGTINIGQSEDDPAESTDRMQRMLTELESITTRLRELVDQLKTLAAVTRCPAPFKRRLRKAQLALSNQAQAITANAKSMRRRLFAPQILRALQLPDYKNCFAKSHQIPLYPASLTPSAPAHRNDSCSRD